MNEEQSRRITRGDHPVGHKNVNTLGIYNKSDEEVIPLKIKNSDMVFLFRYEQVGRFASRSFGP